MSYLGDRYYIEQVLAGNPKAFAFLVDQHKDMVFTVAYRILRDREDAEEVAQDAFIKAYQSLGAFEQKSKFSTWIYRIVYNAAISRTRRKKIESHLLDDQVVKNYTGDSILENLDLMNHEEQVSLIDKLMRTLDKEESALVTLFYTEELSTEQIAHITGLTQSNVKVKLHRLRNKMNATLQKFVRLEVNNKIYH